MKRIILLSCACLLSIFTFSETEHSLKKYFKDNILKLDPIEGAYSVSMRQWVTPSAGESSVIDGTTTWYVKKNYNEFAIYNIDGLYLKQFNIKRIGDTNAYLFNFNDYVYGYESHQFVLQNDVLFEFTHEFTPSTVKRQINNTYGIPLNGIHSYHKMRAIKSYPTSSMYLEAAKKDAEQAEKELQEAIEQAQRKAGWSGSGFALAKGHIVTNYHVVENAKTILVKGIKGDFATEYRASVVATDKVNDIAIIKISDDRFKGFGATPYKIKRAMSDVGESVWALGYPMVGVMGDEVKFTDGKISARTGIQGDMSVYQISVPIQPGNSGGPLFDNYGNIVGITSSGLNREAFNSENVNYAIKTSYLYNLIESSMSASFLPQGTAMQGQSLTEKIKLAKKFVYIILCSEDPNFHSSTAPKSNENKQTSHSDKSEQRHEMKRIETKSMGLVRIEYPTFQSQDNELKVLEVSIDSHETIIKCSWQNNTYNPYGWCNISPKVYVQCKKTSNKYNLKYPLGIPLSPDRESVVYGKYQTFSLVFNAIPIDTESIDLIEPGDSSWKVYNIKLR